jgi:uncharacterized protein (DUF1684 family)
VKRLLILSVLAVLACRHHNAQFEQDEMKWRAERRARLTSDSSWLTLVGLHWLQPGTNDVTIAGTPPLTVRFTLANRVVTVEPDPRLTIEGKPVTAPTPLVDDTSDKGPTIVKAGTRSMQAIKRNDKFAIRAKDTQSEARRNFKGLDYFPPNESDRVEARFEPYNPPKKIPITNVLGMTSDETSPGALVFTLDGTEYRLDPILEQGEKDLFIIFKDATAGHETYGAARYLYASPPVNGKTIVDFNHAYNPPCAFTPYATCPLPPPQNRLPIRIEAGEKKYAGGHA